MWSTAPATLAPILAAALLGGCVDTSPDRVLLNADIEDVQLSVEEAALVTAVRGQFVLVVELGDLAESDAVIEEPPTFNLVRTSDSRIIRLLDAVPNGAVFPLALEPGATERIALALSDQNVVPADQRDDLCEGEVVISGSLEHEAGSQAVQFQSAPFIPTGC